MGFFKDLFGAQQPCDLCRLGEARWTRDRTGGIDWTLVMGGANVKLRICPLCASAIGRLGATHKNPVAVLGLLAQTGQVQIAKPVAYLAHPGWRHVWMHTFGDMGLRVADEFQAAHAIEELTRGIADSGVTPASAQDSEVDDRLLGASLHQLISRRLQEDPTVQRLRDYAEALGSEASQRFPFHMRAILLYSGLLAIRQVFGPRVAQAAVFRAAFLGLQHYREESRDRAARALHETLNRYDKAHSSAVADYAVETFGALASRYMFGSEELAGEVTRLIEESVRDLQEFAGDFEDC